MVSLHHMLDIILYKMIFRTAFCASFPCNNYRLHCAIRLCKMRESGVRYFLCILWAKHWTAPAAAAASNCTGPSAAGSRHGGTPPAVFCGSGKNSCAEMRNTRSLPASCSTACGIPAPLASRLKGTKGSFHIIENGRLLHPSVQQAAVLSFTVLR